jgi:hypothetical protein
MTRVTKKEIMYQERLNIPYKFLRFATPRDVALYRAERLFKSFNINSKIILEIGAGIGGQTFALSKFFEKVICVEIDKEKTLFLKNNLQKLKIFNVEIINGDALNKSVINKINKYKIDIIFVDSERPEQSERTLKSIKPNLKDILKNYIPLCENIAIEIPPFTQDLDELNKEYSFEEEFISMDFNLNRLTLYFNNLKKHEISAINLPSKEMIFFDNNKNSENFNQFNKTDKLNNIEVKEVSSLKNFKFLYSIDETLIVSNLYKKLKEKLNLSFLKLDKPVFLSSSLIHSNFLIPFKIKAFVKGDKKQLIRKIKELNAKKVILRYNIDPKDYWKIRREYESKLNGNKEIHLFFNPKKDYYLLCEKI